MKPAEHTAVARTSRTDVGSEAVWDRHVKDAGVRGERLATRRAGQTCKSNAATVSYMLDRYNCNFAIKNTVR